VKQRWRRRGRAQAGAERAAYLAILALHNVHARLQVGRPRHVGHPAGAARVHWARTGLKGEEGRGWKTLWEPRIHMAGFYF